MDVTESQETGGARAGSAPSNGAPPPDEGAAEPGGGPDSAFAELLDLARAALEGESPQTAVALGHVFRYRDQVLAAGKPELLSEVLPVVRAIAARSSNRTVIEEVRHFVPSTVRRMAAWPELAQTFEVEALQAELDEITDRQNATLPRLLPLAALALAVTGGILSLLVAPRMETDPDTWNLVGLVLMPTGLVLAVLLWVGRRVSEASLKAQADNVGRKLNLRRISGGMDSPYLDPGSEGAGAAPGGEYFGNLVRINVDNLSDYYTQVRVHTNNSFWASIAAGGLGFLLIVAGLTVGFVQGDAESISFVATGSGVAVEFISGVFFYLYNRTVRQLKDYHDSLLDVQNILLSFRIVEQTGEQQRGALFEKILDFLLKQRATAAP